MTDAQSHRSREMFDRLMTLVEKHPTVPFQILVSLAQHADEVIHGAPSDVVPIGIMGLGNGKR